MSYYQLLIFQKNLRHKDEEDEGKRGENQFLKTLLFEGAKKRYGEDY